jgi:hypothetical protein
VGSQIGGHGLLTSAGFTGDDALDIYRVLFAYLHGHVLNELQEIIERPEETDHVLQLGLHHRPHRSPNPPRRITLHHLIRTGRSLPQHVPGYPLNSDVENSDG